jgi:lysozyme
MSAPNNSVSRLKQGTAAGLILVTTLTTFEGVRTHAYPDPATGGKPWTICMGQTAGVHPGMVKTLAECKADLYATIPKYAAPIAQCAKVPLPDKRFIAFVSLAWNIGPGKACASKAMQLINKGKVREGCEAFMKYVYAAGIKFPGLVKRRAAERALCLEPISPSNPVGVATWTP